LENRKSWIEGGYKFGHQFNAITGFLLNPINVFCSPRAGRTVPDCITDNSQPGAPVVAEIVAEREGRFRHGFFLNFKLVVPLHSKLSYVVENEGEYFFTRGFVDNSTDTRYQDVLTQALSIPLLGNLFFEPKLRLFWYQNKIEHTRFWQRQYGLTINYKFDWFKGNRVRDALSYKKP
jgi:hypothetical protein